MTSVHPLVSRICVTHHAADVLKRVIACFQNQSYPNKELILGITSDNKDAITLLNQLEDFRIEGRDSLKFF